jgi:hypothetical protein
MFKAFVPLKLACGSFLLEYGRAKASEKLREHLAGCRSSPGGRRGAIGRQLPGDQHGDAGSVKDNRICIVGLNDDTASSPFNIHKMARQLRVDR